MHWRVRSWPLVSMRSSLVELATLNNIHWHHAMFKAHGLASETDAVAWYSLETPPPFHSNLVVLAEDAIQADIEVRLRRVDERRVTNGWGLKDSYARLDLHPLGFQTLFSASWLWLAHTTQAAAPHPNAEVAWMRIDTIAGLAEWERAWACAPQNRDETPAPRQFPSSLLQNPDLLFFAGWSQGRIVAGGVANRSPDAVGLSNLFVRTDPPCNIWPVLIRWAREAFPRLPLVGYERGDPLELALQAGFSEVGRLRVWHKPAAE